MQNDITKLNIVDPEIKKQLRSIASKSCKFYSCILHTALLTCALLLQLQSRAPNCADAEPEVQNKSTLAALWS